MGILCGRAGIGWYQLSSSTLNMLKEYIKENGLDLRTYEESIERQRFRLSDNDNSLEIMLTPELEV